MTDQAQRYDRMAAGYERWWAPVLAPSAVGLLERIDPVARAAGDVLDVGVGTGNLAIPAIQRWPSMRVMGIDAWGWDAPLHLQAQRAQQSGERGVFWEAHQADLPYSQIERLVNLGELPATGFQVSCFPLRIVGASGAPARVVAMVP